MEGTKKTTSSSSFTSDLFGSKETSASSSSGIFNSIFPPPSKGHGSVNSEQSKQNPVTQERNAKDSPKMLLYPCWILHKGTTFGVSDMLLSIHLEESEQHRFNLWKLRKDKLSTCGSTPTSNEAASQAAQNKQPSSFYQNEKVQPCHLSSSIYYGGQDVYSFPQNNQSSTNTTVNKDNGEDDSGSASRGNWWRGSLYY